MTRHWVWYAEVRVDTWVETGMVVTPFYDSLIAKLMVHASDRQAAITKLLRALSLTQVPHPRFSPLIVVVLKLEPPMYFLHLFHKPVLAIYSKPPKMLSGEQA